MLKVIEGVTTAMMDFSPEHVRPAAKCMMRIYRDTRFSNDKTPYKTQVAAWWSRHGLEKTSGGGYYMHISAENLTIAAGVYMPERDQLMAIRTFLLDHHEELRRLLQDKKLLRLFTLDNGEMLTRPPKGFPADHPGDRPAQVPAMGGICPAARRRGAFAEAGKNRSRPFSRRCAAGEATQSTAGFDAQRQGPAAVWPVLTRECAPPKVGKNGAKRPKIHKTLKKPKKTCGNSAFAIDKTFAKSHG